jgi:hypothetical protein
VTTWIPTFQWSIMPTYSELKWGMGIKLGHICSSSQCHDANEVGWSVGRSVFLSINQSVLVSTFLGTRDWILVLSLNNRNLTYPGGRLCYKPGGRGFKSRWGNWIFSIDLILQPHYGPGVDSTSDRNEYRELIKSFSWRVKRGDA